MSLAAYTKKTNQHKLSLEETILHLNKKNMQKIRVTFSGPIYVSHHLLFKTVLSFMIIFLKQSQTEGLLGD